VLDLRDSPWVDGPGRTILDCAETLDALRVRVVIGAFDGGSLMELLTRRRPDRGLEAFRIQERRSLDPGVLRQVIDLGRSVRSRCSYIRTIFGLIFSAWSARAALGVPLIATVHGWIENDIKGRIRTALDKLILRQADHVISVSEETRLRLGRWAGPERCTVIPNAVRVERYQPRRGQGKFRASLGVAEDELLIANIGRLSPEKGQACLPGRRPGSRPEACQNALRSDRARAGPGRTGAFRGPERHWVHT
jgi:glycosyltransferase involved in cell wall biosynthesis